MGNVATSTRILAALRELIGALDRRTPHVGNIDSQELVEEIMTDDGGPPEREGEQTSVADPSPSCCQQAEDFGLLERGPLERDRAGQKIGAGRPAGRDPGL